MFNVIKSRVCTTKEETPVTTAANDSIMITAAIDANKGKDIMLVDVHNTFFQTNMPHKGNGEIIIIKISVTLVDMLLKLDSEKFKGYVVYENR